MGELIVAAAFVLYGGQQLPDHRVAHGHVLRQMIGSRGSVRHTSGTREPTRRFGADPNFFRLDYVAAGGVYRGRRFAFNATPPRIRDNSVALIDTPAASPITFGNSNVPTSSRLCQTT